MSILSPKKLLIRLSVAATILCAGLLQVSCLDEMAPGNRYTFTGKTVAQFLEDYEDPTKAGESEFSIFIQVLKKVSLWDRLKTYGTFTCFAPTNDAFETYFLGKGEGYNLDSLLSDYATCDTIARTHLMNDTISTKDLQDVLVPYLNLMELRMKVAYTDSIDGQPVELGYWIQDAARLIVPDNSVQNGVVHIVGAVIPASNKTIGDVIRLDTKATLFATALKLTNFDRRGVVQLNQFGDTVKVGSQPYTLGQLMRDRDINYRTPGGDSCIDGKGVTYNTGAESDEHAYFKEYRYFKFTGLIEPDKVFNDKGINNIEDLKNWLMTNKFDSESVYDDNYKDVNNWLYRFVAYHFLPEQMGYTDFNVAMVTQGDVNSKILENQYKKKAGNEVIGIEDFFEAMLPHSIMRISTTNNKVYINRKGFINQAGKVDQGGLPLLVPGVEIRPESANSIAMNGVYHYINDILAYDDFTRTVTLNTRIRIDATTLSPDFINGGGRGGENSKMHGGIGFKRGFAQNVFHSERTRLVVRHRNAGFACYNGDEVNVKGIYDIWFKLPPVPYNSQYDVRMGFCAMSVRGVAQIYFGEMDNEFDDISKLKPVGIPLDLRLGGGDPKIGTFNSDDMAAEDIILQDKAMRNRGYMRGMDVYGGFQNNTSCLRRIFVTETLDPNKNYYIRARQVLENDNAEFMFDYLELVPKSIWGADTPEDTH